MEPNLQSSPKEPWRNKEEEIVASTDQKRLVKFEEPYFLEFIVIANSGANAAYDTIYWYFIHQSISLLNYQEQVADFQRKGQIEKFFAGVNPSTLTATVKVSS